MTYKSRKAEKDATVIARMTALAAQYPRFGYRRIRIYLERDGHKLNRKRMYRLWRAARLSHVGFNFIIEKLRLPHEGEDPVTGRKGWRAVVILALGYPPEGAQMPMGRARVDMGEYVHRERWGQPG